MFFECVKIDYVIRNGCQNFHVSRLPRAFPFCVCVPAEDKMVSPISLSLSGVFLGPALPSGLWVPGKENFLHRCSIHLSAFVADELPGKDAAVPRSRFPVTLRLLFSERRWRRIAGSRISGNPSRPGANPEDGLGYFFYSRKSITDDESSPLRSTRTSFHPSDLPEEVREPEESSPRAGCSAWCQFSREESGRTAKRPSRRTSPSILSHPSKNIYYKLIPIQITFSQPRRITQNNYLAIPASAINTRSSTR